MKKVTHSRFYMSKKQIDLISDLLRLYKERNLEEFATDETKYFMRQYGAAFITKMKVMSQESLKFSKSSAMAFVGRNDE